jgi:uncharacterized protein YbaR (Trm112 family)
MDGIETKVFCPECRHELSLLLEKQEIPSMIEGILKMMGIPKGNEIIYEGSTVCSCGKTVRIRFSIETASDEHPKPRVFVGGIHP